MIMIASFADQIDAQRLAFAWNPRIAAPSLHVPDQSLALRYRPVGRRMDRFPRKRFDGRLLRPGTHAQTVKAIIIYIANENLRHWKVIAQCYQFRKRH
jgi:hypothetical protein